MGQNGLQAGLARRGNVKENARQGYWNGPRPPIGYRIVIAGQRDSKVKKKLEIDPIHADTVRLIYRLALTGDPQRNGSPMGIKSITACLNERNIRTRDGGRWGIASVHQILTRTTYIGEHRFNTRDHKTRAPKPEAEHAIAQVPSIIPEAEFRAVQANLKARSPQWTPPREVSGPTLLTGICFCASCGGAMTLRTGKGSSGGMYRYHACSTTARMVLRSAWTGSTGPSLIIWSDASSILSVCPSFWSSFSTGARNGSSGGAATSPSSTSGRRRPRPS